MKHTINPYRKWIGCQIPNWLLKRTEPSQGAKLCYGRLTQYAGKNGKAFPKQKEIAKELGVSSDRTVRKYLKELQDYGLIKIRQMGKKQSNTYHFLNHKWMEGDRNNTATQCGTNVPLTEEQEFQSHRNNSSDPYEENQLSESIKSSAQEIIDFIASDLEEVQKLEKQLTPKEAAKLVEAYGIDLVRQKLEEMENYKKLTKSYNAVYFTVKRWCKRDQDNKPSSSTLRPGAMDL